MQVGHIEQVINDHENRLKKVETGIENLTKEMTTMQNSQIKLENTVMKEGRDTREILNKLLDHFFKTDTQKLDMKKEVKLKIIATVGSLLGAGGAVTMLVQFFSNN